MGTFFDYFKITEIVLFMKNEALLLLGLHTEVIKPNERNEWMNKFQ